jgi:hypothetical protein
MVRTYVVRTYDFYGQDIWFLWSGHMISMVGTYDFYGQNIWFLWSGHMISVVRTYDFYGQDIWFLWSGHMISMVGTYDFYGQDIWFLWSGHLISMVRTYDFYGQNIRFLWSEHTISMVRTYDFYGQNIWFLWSEHMISKVRTPIRPLDNTEWRYFWIDCRDIFFNDILKWCKTFQLQGCQMVYFQTSCSLDKLRRTLQWKMLVWFMDICCQLVYFSRCLYVYCTMKHLATLFSCIKRYNETIGRRNNLRSRLLLFINGIIKYYNIICL